MLDPDARLTDRLRRGDTAAWQEVARAHYASVYRLTFRMLDNAADAADATQETYCRAFGSRASLRNGRPLRPWLLKIATNLSIDFLRRQGVRSSHTPARSELSDDASDGAHRLIQAEETDRVRAAVGRIPADYRAVLVLRFQQGLNCEQIADTLDISLSAVWTRLSRAKAMVRKILEHDER